MLNPVAVLIDKGLNYVINTSPDWEDTQPLEFKVRVVESWKKSICSELKTNCKITWQLPLADKLFQCDAPIFCQLDWNYNPYVLGFHEPHLLTKIK